MTLARTVRKIFMITLERRPCGMCAWAMGDNSWQLIKIAYSNIVHVYFIRLIVGG